MNAETLLAMAVIIAIGFLAAKLATTGGTHND